MPPSHVLALFAVLTKQQLTATSLPIAFIVVFCAITASAWSPPKAYDDQEVREVSEASHTLVWWLDLLLAVAGIGAAAWAGLLVASWCRAYRRRAENAERSKEIEKSIRLMTARLYRTRQLWQARQMQADQQQHDSSPEQLFHEPVNQRTDQPPAHTCKQSKKRIASYDASHEDDEVAFNSNTAAPAPGSPYFQVLSSPVYQPHLRTVSESSSYRYTLECSADFLTSQSDSLVPPPALRNGVKYAARPQPSLRSASPAPPRPSAFKRVFGGTLQITALRRALRAPQLRIKQSGSTSLPKPSRCPSHQSLQLSASVRDTASVHYKGISSFYFPTDSSITFMLEAGESFDDDSAAETVATHGGEDAAEGLCGTGDCSSETGLDDLAHRTGIAETGESSSFSFHEEFVEEPGAAQVWQQSHHRPAAEEELYRMPSLRSLSGHQLQCQDVVPQRGKIPVAEGSRVDCAADMGATAPQALRAECRADETVGANNNMGGVVFLERSLVDENERLEGPFLHGRRLNWTRGPNSSPTLHTSLNSHRFAGANIMLPNNTRRSSSADPTKATGASLHQELLHSSKTRRYMKSLQSSLAPLPLLPLPERVTSTTAKEALGSPVAQ
ncbi:hypothetical protein LSCM1_06379 [Leishmania martiniquensis]|uniref:Uncharacterized protein n=1 Tax=Leishmania martiniquensis TaxID=1580590 RepID=A0A836KRE2_9TRYP|nr:hypothetical protein LSCM1_06379 [Leishmania martiniquensis]